jgi:hypothetical protein
VDEAGWLGMGVRRHGRRFATGAVLAGFVVCPAVVQAAVSPGGIDFDPVSERETFLLSRSYFGGIPNGASRNAAFSGDSQLATRIVFESDASDIVPDDTNGATDVFVVRRAAPYDRDGPPWRARDTLLVSRAADGGPANGPSYGPDVDGDRVAAPRCVAFVSRATNLVPGDTNGQPDAFVADMDSGEIARVSVSSSGRQANGPTIDVRIDGECGRVAFTSRATNLALTRTGRRQWRSAVTTAPPRGTRQVYVHVLSDDKDNRGLKGLTFLASASDAGRAGDGDSFDVSMARGAGGCPERCGDYFGEALAFASDATNLSPKDRNGATDVYLRRFERTMRPSRPVSRARPVGGLAFDTQLISAAASGAAGNGPSGHPAANDRGDIIAFDTRAWDLVQYDFNALSDVVRAVVTPRDVKFELVSNYFGFGNGDSLNPTITRPGSPIFFESDATNLVKTRGTDRNGIRDIFFWNIIKRNATVQSRDSSQSALGLPIDFLIGVGPPGVLAAPNTNPATSYYGNYIVFETANPLVDLKVAQEQMPDYLASRALAALESRRRPELHQLYLRYIGPR